MEKKYKISPGIRQWQKNRARPVQGQFCQGVDLQRNFPFQWEQTSENQCATDYAGVLGGTEAETQLTIDLINEKNIDALLVLSTGSSQNVQFPFRYDNVKVSGQIESLEHFFESNCRPQSNRLKTTMM